MSNEAEVQVEEVEIEAHTQMVGGKEKAPKAKKYVIRVNKEKFTVEVASMTGSQILTLAGFTPPDAYKLTEKLHGGGAKTIGLADEVDFTAPGVERFLTFKRDQTEG